MIKVINSAPGAADLYISGDIVEDGAFWAGEDAAGYEFPAKVKAQLDALAGKDLTIYINSSGGSVPAGMAIAGLIRRHDGATTARVEGWCCSIATMIFFAAQRRIMPANAYLMIHKPSTAAYGDAADMRRAADMLETIQEGIETVYRAAARPGVTAEEIHEMVENETWMTGEEAARVFQIETEDALQIAACAGGIQKAWKNTPKGIPLAPKAQANQHIKAKATIVDALRRAKGALQ